MDNLYSHQQEALKKMHNGCILCGGVGSGKSRTALAYYHLYSGGKIRIDGKGQWECRKKDIPLIIITTAKKRDDGEWLDECNQFFIGENEVIVDSWNNVKKYRNLAGCFFIFDEQRVTGSGVWVRSFIRIARRNKWILLSATPGDTWSDYIPVFVANGYYKNKTEFLSLHAVYNRFSKFPKIDRWLEEDKLEKIRDEVLVNMPFERKTVRHNIDILCDYDKAKYKSVWRDRWDVFKDEPIAETGALFYAMRKVVNSDDSRLFQFTDICKAYNRIIVFYNFDYELEIIKGSLDFHNIPYYEWNGHNHDKLPEDGRWVYLVQYSAGCEGWNCITTNVIIFYSQTYSYKQLEQAAGRIDRLNTPYRDLYYYHFRSHAPIDIAIHKALKRKKKFNEHAYLGNNKI